MSHPFLGLSSHQRNRLFWLSLVFSVAIMAIMGIIGEPLITPQAPLGIVSFELAGTPDQAEAILASWDERAKQHAAFSLGFDYLYMLAYSAVLGLGCLLAAAAVRAKAWPLAAIGVPLAWGMWLAAVFDALENLGLTLILLTGEAANLWPAVSRICALLKFALLFIGLVYCCYGLLAGFTRRLRH
jgi:hypothetical protein